MLVTASDGWGYFFLTCSPILDWGDFSQVILPIVLQIMPQPKNNPNHQVLWTASDGWGLIFFFDLCSHSGLRAFFTNDFANCTTDYAPTIRLCPTISDAVHSIIPTIRCCCTWWLGLIFFFDLFSHSGLRAFFTSDFANCTTNYAQPSGAVHSIWWLGVIFFFWPVLPFWT